MKGRRSRSRSPLRRNGNNDRRSGGRDRNFSKSGFSHHSDKMVYLSNIPYEMSWMELKAIIRERAGEVTFVETLEDRDGRAKGCAVVEFKTKDSALKCVEIMHRQELKGRNILAKEIRDPIAFFRKVKEDTGVDFLGSRDRNFGKNRYEDQLTIENETYGLSPAFLNQLNIKTPLIDRVFITNISFTCGVGRLFDICSLAGKVVWFDLQLDKDGKSKGMAICQYSHPIEAVQAISMLNGQRVYDRILTVKMDRFEKEQDRREGELPIGLRGIGMGLGANGAPLADVASVISSISSNTAQSIVQQTQPLSILGTNPFGNTISNPFVSNNQLQQLQQQTLIQPFSNDNTVAAANGLLNHSFTSAIQQVTNNSAFGPQQAQSSGYYTGNQTNNPSSGQIQSLFSSKIGQPYNSNSGPTSILSRENGNTSSGSHGNHSFNSGVQSVFGNSSSNNGNLYEASRIILIKNLPMDYTWQIVSDRVQQFGDLDSVEMISPGVAKVRFIQLVDAERAKKTLQGTTVEGRMIGIEYL